MEAMREEREKVETSFKLKNISINFLINYMVREFFYITYLLDFYSASGSRCYHYAST